MQCEVLKIDEARRNIVVSRRLLIEKQRQEDREQLLRELEVRQLRKGIVKNIAEFGAFVDLGGIDGLLHITDMSHGRIGHPSEMVSIDQEIEVHDPEHRPRKGKDRAGTETEIAQSVGSKSRQSTQSAAPWKARLST